MEKTYNGWTNYATWKVNLELFDGFDVSDYLSADDVKDDRDKATYTLSNALEEMAHEILEQYAKGIALDFARSFIADVNFYEIAEHMVDDYAEANAMTGD